VDASADGAEHGRLDVGRTDSLLTGLRLRCEGPGHGLHPVRIWLFAWVAQPEDAAAKIRCGRGSRGARLVPRPGL